MNAKTQIKFKIDSDIVSAFKAQCASEGVSMTSVVERCMKSSRIISAKSKIQTRPQRRAAVQNYIDCLEEILDSEQLYRDLIPEHFTQRYEDSDISCEKLSDAVECLRDAF